MIPISRHAVSLAVLVLASTLVALAVSGVAAEPQNSVESWSQTWERDGVASTIRRHLDAVDGDRMRQDLFHLAKSPLPFRKLNFTVPGHEESTLHEADDYMASPNSATCRTPQRPFGQRWRPFLHST